MIVNANSLRMPIADNSIQCCVTSPPYYGLRSYGIGTENGELGLEPTPQEYIANLVAVFREVRRVLAEDGTAFLNLGDSYSNQDKTGGSGGNKNYTSSAGGYYRGQRNTGLKPKDLMMIPARVALALQADGWYLRAEIVWAKPNPMPESVTDRPTRSHEMIYLLTKQARYYYDADAVKEPIADSSLARISQANFDNQQGGEKDYGEDSNRSARKALENFAKKSAPASWHGSSFTSKYDSETKRGLGMGERQTDDTGYRNQRDVWTLATESYSGAHYAVFPTEIPRRAIRAGSRPGDVVLDPFCGSGTTGLVCRELGRSFVGLDLSLEYLRTLALPRAERKQATDAHLSLPLFQEALP